MTLVRPGRFFFLGGNCPGGNYPGGNCPHGDIARGGTVLGKLYGGELTGHLSTVYLIAFGIQLDANQEINVKPRIKLSGLKVFNHINDKVCTTS